VIARLLLSKLAYLRVAPTQRTGIRAARRLARLRERDMPDATVASAHTGGPVARGVPAPIESAGLRRPASAAEQNDHSAPAIATRCVAASRRTCRRFKLPLCNRFCAAKRRITRHRGDCTSRHAAPGRPREAGFLIGSPAQRSHTAADADVRVVDEGLSMSPWLASFFRRIPCRPRPCVRPVPTTVRHDRSVVLSWQAQLQARRNRSQPGAWPAARNTGCQ
jgi:hypothetical protein